MGFLQERDKMIDESIKAVLNEEGKRLGKILPNFYGKISFNFFNGTCANFNIEQTVKNDNLNERNRNVETRNGRLDSD